MSTGLPTASKTQPLTITELTRLVKSLVERGIGEVWLEGEISNFKRYGSGHCYFTLKDDGAQLSSVLWRAVADSLRFEPRDGMKVIAKGRISVYEPRGQYQFVVEKIEPSGLGALFAAYEALKAKLADEGLFDDDRKRPLPPFPQRVGLVTSPSGAAVRDMLKVLWGRWPTLDVILAPCRVQGDGAAAEIAHAIKLVNTLPEQDRPDVLIVGRGGGSLEDLWAFNEEVVARAIFTSDIPIVSAVGHEVDFTIADFVADVRAATPSHAAEMVAPEYAGVLEHLKRLEEQLPEALLGKVEWARARLESLANHWALRNPEERIARFRQRVDELQSRLEPLLRRSGERRKDRLLALMQRLESLSPLKVLERGYSVTQQADSGNVVRDADSVKEGDEIVTRLRKGKVRSKVIRKEE